MKPECKPWTAPLVCDPLVDIYFAISEMYALKTLFGAHATRTKVLAQFLAYCGFYWCYNVLNLLN